MEADCFHSEVHLWKPKRPSDCRGIRAFHRQLLQQKEENVWWWAAQCTCETALSQVGLKEKWEWMEIKQQAAVHRFEPSYSKENEAAQSCTKVSKVPVLSDGVRPIAHSFHHHKHALLHNTHSKFHHLSTRYWTGIKFCGSSGNSAKCLLWV